MAQSIDPILGQETALRRYKADIFSVLGHPTRIHIIEILRERELPAGTITEILGVEQANASQHLAILRGKGLVTTRKEANQVFYSLKDPLLSAVLDDMKAFFIRHLEEAKQALAEMEAEANRS